MNTKNMYCNNCGSRGHLFKTCKDPVTSCGILLLKEKSEPMKLPVNPAYTSVLMVRRKDSMAYMEFMRGKYDIANTEFVKRLVSNMTIQEQQLIVNETFDTLWLKLWGPGRDTHSIEYELSKTQYETVDRKALVEAAPSVYVEPEWGFPKGRRSKGETDIECAIREFWEETNIPRDAYEILPNLSFTEIFTGTNEVKYKHIYFVALLKDSNHATIKQKLNHIQQREIASVSWKTLQECKTITRPHYVERKLLIDDLERKIRA